MEPNTIVLLSRAQSLAVQRFQEAVEAFWAMNILSSQKDVEMQLALVQQASEGLFTAFPHMAQKIRASVQGIDEHAPEHMYDDGYYGPLFELFRLIFAFSLEPHAELLSRNQLEINQHLHDVIAWSAHYNHDRARWRL